MNSFNHYAFGAVGEFLYGVVGGIREESPGYKTILIQPVMRDGLTWTTTSLDTIHGRIECAWSRQGSKISIRVIVPPNTTATVHVPARDEASMIEGGKPARQAAGVSMMRMENGAAVLAIGSGEYRFQTVASASCDGAAGAP
jgi:alpha-L-rhamnosidase